MQSGVSISDGVISGTLAHVTDYTGFSSDPEEQEGHYLVLKFTAADDAVVTVELINGTLGHPVTLDEDMNIVIRITDVDEQSIEVVVTEGTAKMTKTYTLTGLTLAE